ncbi:MAG: hypothetical protein AAGA88_03390 [Pseudomonadota bacterium]
MKAINLSHFKRKLQDVSKGLFLDHGWVLPNGLKDKGLKNPFNFTRAEWQQAKRIGQDAKALKAMFAETWATSDNASSLQAALAERGYLLAKGDRRGVVAVDYRGEVYALSRWSGVKARDVKSRFGKEPDLPAVADVKANIASRITQQLKGYIVEVEGTFTKKSATLNLKRSQLKTRQIAERQRLREAHTSRWERETLERSARFRRGFAGLWDRFTGRHGETRRQNEREVLQRVHFMLDHIRRR